MSRSLPTAAVLLCLGLNVVSTRAQDPLSVSPDAYRLEFENAWVKVVRVTYGPNAVIAPHLHTERASAYVYLNDGGPILFKHEGLPYAGVTRPPTKAGSFRVYKGIKEVHSVENPTPIPSDFLRVELKTEPLEDSTLKGKFFPDASTPTATVQQIQFENAQVRVTRARVVPGDAVRLTAHSQPALIVVLSPVEFVEAAGRRRLADTGTTAWIDTGQATSLQASGAAGEVLRFDLKSRPMATR